MQRHDIYGHENQAAKGYYISEMKAIDTNQFSAQTNIEINRYLDSLEYIQEAVDQKIQMQEQKLPTKKKQLLDISDQEYKRSTKEKRCVSQPLL